MALGGAISATALTSDVVPRAIGLVAASVIAPGFEPLAKVPLGLVLGHRHVALRGLRSAAVGYTVLMAAAALVFWILRGLGEFSAQELARNPEVRLFASPSGADWIISACAAVAGMIMLAAYRRSVIAGPLMALAIVPAAAMTGMALAAGRPALVREGLERMGMDVLLIWAAGALVMWTKQHFTHKRRPLV